jgi:UDP-glucuronate 4-epimerase
MAKVYVTGAAGLIGFHLCKQLAKAGHLVSGIDNYNDYYDPQLKRDRAAILATEHPDIVIEEGDIKNKMWLSWEKDKPDVVIHLAAYANPRHSLDNPRMYIDTNITGTQNLIEACELHGVDNVIYASSSCVMHGQELPWKEDDRPGHQNNPYGWSKRVNECQFKHSKIKRTIGLRFFTVYGPYGRPDMALFLFTKGIIDGTPITAFNNGNMIRDFTYVDDIVDGVSLVTDRILGIERSRFSDENTTVGSVISSGYGMLPTGNMSGWIPNDPHYDEIYNIGYGEQVNLMDFIRHISDEVGKPAIIDFKPAHPADVPATWSDCGKLKSLGYRPKIGIEEGVKRFVKWYRAYYAV